MRVLISLTKGALALVVICLAPVVAYWVSGWKGIFYLVGVPLGLVGSFAAVVLAVCLRDYVGRNAGSWSSKHPGVFFPLAGLLSGFGILGAGLAVALLIAPEKHYCPPGGSLRIGKAHLIKGANPERAKVDDVLAPDWITAHPMFVHHRYTGEFKDSKGRGGDGGYSIDACDLQGTIKVADNAPSAKMRTS